MQGAITDLACAILLGPRICERMTCIRIGGADYPDGGEESNLMSCVHATNVVLSPIMGLLMVLAVIVVDRLPFNYADLFRIWSMITLVILPVGIVMPLALCIYYFDHAAFQFPSCQHPSSPGSLMPLTHENVCLWAGFFDRL